ncbi:MAG: hypothetical protein HYV04_16135 [Deltaproteobacteria bacterium]|nr:hypothetical protein [Deltaproteobacteria bacterium]
MIGERAWGPVPPGFTGICPNPGQRIVVSARLASYIDGSRFFDEVSSAEAMSPFSGRGPIRAYRLENGETALIRAYHRGGLVRYLTRSFFFTWPPRPFKELALTEQARRRGVPTPEILGACVDRVWGPFYRGWLMSRELEGGQDLWAALHSEWYQGAERRSLLEAVASSLRTMHRRGVYSRISWSAASRVRFEATLSISTRRAYLPAPSLPRWRKKICGACCARRASSTRKEAGCRRRTGSCWFNVTGRMSDRDSAATSSYRASRLDRGRDPRPAACQPGAPRVSQGEDRLGHRASRLAFGGAAPGGGRGNRF